MVSFRANGLVQDDGDDSVCGNDQGFRLERFLNRALGGFSRRRRRVRIRVRTARLVCRFLASCEDHAERERAHKNGSVTTNHQIPPEGWVSLFIKHTPKRNEIKLASRRLCRSSNREPAITRGGTR